MSIKIILLIGWIAASLIEGCRDGHFYHNRNTSTNPDKENMHWLFAMERFIIISLISWTYLLSHQIISSILFIGGLILIFSFFHNGMYYLTRNRLDKNVYPKGWWDTSTTSTSSIELNTLHRTVLMIIGFAAIALTFISPIIK